MDYLVSSEEVGINKKTFQKIIKLLDIKFRIDDFDSLLMTLSRKNNEFNYIFN